MFIVYFLPLILFGVVLYFFMIRPERKKQAALRQEVANLTKNDKVITNSGIIGTVEKVNDNSVVIKTGTASIEFRKEAIMKIEKKESK